MEDTEAKGPPDKTKGLMKKLVNKLLNRTSSQSVDHWKAAKSFISPLLQDIEAKLEPKLEPKIEPKAESKAESKIEPRQVSKTATRADLPVLIAKPNSMRDWHAAKTDTAPRERQAELEEKNQLAITQTRMPSLKLTDFAHQIEAETTGSSKLYLSDDAGAEETSSRFVDDWNWTPDVNLFLIYPTPIQLDIDLDDRFFELDSAGLDMGYELAPRPRKQSSTATDLPSISHPFTTFCTNTLRLIAQSKHTQAFDLAWLATRNSIELKSLVIKNPNSSIDTLSLLSTDEEPGIRLCVAENLRTPPDVLDALVHDQNSLVGWSARNTLTYLREHEKEEPIVIQPQEVLPVSDRDWLAQQEPTKVVEADEEREHKNDLELLRDMAAHQYTSTQGLAALSKHEDLQVRIHVAGNRNTPIDVLLNLCKDPEALVRIKLIENFNCPFEALEQLKDDSDNQVRWQARNVLKELKGGSDLSSTPANLSTSLSLH